MRALPPRSSAILIGVVVGVAGVFGASSPRAQSVPAAAQGGAGAPAPRPSPFVPPEPIDHNARDGWISLFDGKTLTGWDGNPDVWHVEGGAIVADSTAERRVGSTHLIWQGGDVADFELMIDYKLDGDIHSGIAYRSYVDVNRSAAGRAAGPAGAAAAARPAPQIPTNPKWTLYGPGFDFDADRQMAANVEDRGTDRRELAWRGGIVRALPGVRPRLIGTLGSADDLMALIKPVDWNRIHIIARGHQITHIVNDRVMTILYDDDPAYFRASGQIGIQIESYGLGRVNAKEVWLKKW